MAHHSLCATLSIALLLFRYIDITYKKWHCAFFTLTAYMTVGAFLMETFHMEDAFHIALPLIPDTPLTAWVMAPMYFAGHGLILLIAELIKRKKVSAVHER